MSYRTFTSGFSPLPHKEMTQDPDMDVDHTILLKNLKFRHSEMCSDEFYFFTSHLRGVILSSSCDRVW